MRLKRFSVKGFKNFRQEIVLEDMGTICVIHGENNVGKSNVLEAMQLFFQLFHKIQKAHNELKMTKKIPQSQAPFFENQFALIGVDRRIYEKEIETERLMVPQTLLLKLYDARDSLEPAIFEKWELFVRTMQKFNDVLGVGEFKGATIKDCPYETDYDVGAIPSGCP